MEVMAGSLELLRPQQSVDEIDEQKESRDAGDDVIHFDLPFYSLSHALVNAHETAKNRMAIST
jgi:hypothetical protein